MYCMLLCIDAHSWLLPILYAVCSSHRWGLHWHISTDKVGYICWHMEQGNLPVGWCVKHLKNHPQHCASLASGWQEAVQLFYCKNIAWVYWSAFVSVHCCFFVFISVHHACFIISTLNLWNCISVPRHCAHIVLCTWVARSWKHSLPSTWNGNWYLSLQLTPLDRIVLATAVAKQPEQHNNNGCWANLATVHLLNPLLSG